MPKVLFVFAGTGGVASQVRDQYEGEGLNDDVVRVYFNGCQDREMSGLPLKLGTISPNLDVVGAKIRTCFDDAGNLSLSSLQKKFGSAVIIKPDVKPKASDPAVVVDSISMMGFSRGGVTTFAVARHLDDLDKPINLYAEDPVPGNSKSNAKENSSEFYKNHDLRSCKNIRRAVVNIGGYKNNVNPLHNKFFRQMAPLFSEECDTSVYVVPKENHLSLSRMESNQQKDFLVRVGLVAAPMYYDDAQDDLNFIPKVIQQKTHIGTMGRVEFSTRYKKQLYEVVSVHHKLKPDQSFKSIQALHALDQGPKTDAKKSLYEIVKNNTSPKGKAIREFLVEFERINNYACSKPISVTTKKAMDDYRAQVYDLLSFFPVENVTSEQERKFRNGMLASFREMEKEIPEKDFKKLEQLTNLFLKNNVLFHSDLTRYIDETETRDKKLATLKDADFALRTVKTASNGEELAEILFNLSENSREAAYPRFHQNVNAIIKNAQQLGGVMRFLPAKHVTSMLEKPEMKQLITDMIDLNGIMRKMSSPSQKIAVFHAMKDSIVHLKPDFEQLSEFMQHLSTDKCIKLLKAIPLSKISTTSSTDMIKFFQKLDDQQFNKLLPVMAKDIKKYLSHRVGYDKDQHLQNYLHSRATNSEAVKALHSIFPNIAKLSTAQKSFKSHLTAITKEEAPAPNLFVKL